MLSFTDWVISVEIRVVIILAGDCGIFGTNEWVHSTTIKTTRMTLIWQTGDFGGNWKHVAHAYDGQYVKVYVDGKRSTQ